MKTIKKTAIVGMGALGILYGSHIQKACGEEAVEFVMNQERIEKYRDTEFSCNGEKMRFRMMSQQEAKPADLLIVAVKYTGLEEALHTMANCVGEDTVIISVMNGINSEEIIGKAFGMEKVIYTVAQGMDAMKFGSDLQYTRMGQLHIGMTKNSVQERLDRLVSFLESIQMPFVLEQDILYRMWGKFMLNVGLNQTCMVYGVNYSQVLAKGEPNRTMVSAMREVVALAQKEGVNLTEEDLSSYVELIRSLNPLGTPSMGQDRINQKASEVDMFAGVVLSLAEKNHLLVPVNEFLYERAKEIEKEYVGK